MTLAPALELEGSEQMMDRGMGGNESRTLDAFYDGVLRPAMGCIMGFGLGSGLGFIMGFGTGHRHFTIGSIWSVLVLVGGSA